MVKSATSYDFFGSIFMGDRILCEHREQLNNLFVNIRLRSARILNKIARILNLNEKHILYTIHDTQNYLKNSRTMRGGQ